MKAIEDENEELGGVVPGTNALTNSNLITVLRNVNAICDVDGTVFGKVCEYFIGSRPWSRERRP